MMNEEQLQAIEEQYTRDYGELPSFARAAVPALVAEVRRLRAELAGARLAGCAYRALSEIAPQWIDSDDALPTERGYYMARWSDKKVPAWFDPKLMPSRGQWVLCDETGKRCNSPIEWLYDGATTPDGAE